MNKPKGVGNKILLIFLVVIVGCLLIDVIMVNPGSDKTEKITNEEIAKPEKDQPHNYLPIINREQTTPPTFSLAVAPTVIVPKALTATRYVAPTATQYIAIPPTKRSVEIQNCTDGCTNHISGCDIKGNISLTTGERIYHVPGGEYYNKTNIDPQYGERWFCTEEEARQAGWRKSYR